MGSLVAELAEKLSSATNSIDFDEQTLFLNTSANTVGVGTNAPAAKLDVRGSAIFNEDSADVDFRIESNGQANMFFVNGGTDRVGIGTSAPLNHLDVSASAASASIAAHAFSTTATQAGTLELGRSNHATLGNMTAIDSSDVMGAIAFTGANGSGFVTGATIEALATETHSGTASGTEMLFKTTDNTTQVNDIRMVIAHDGKVGIGTTAPGSLLHLHSTGTPILEMKTTGTVDREYQLQVVHGDGRFSIRDETGSANRVALLTSGNFGIGVDAPASLLHVAGTVQVGVNDTGHDVYFYGATSGAYMYWNQAGDKLRIRGPVGTGAATAGVLRLETAETSVVDADQLGRIEFQAPVDGAGSDAILVGASIYAEADATFSSTVNSTDLVFATGDSAAATEKLRIDSIGHTTPGADNTQDLGSAAKRWKNMYTADLHLANERGDWTVIEEEKYLTLRNNKTDKVYKLVMEEIE